MESLVQLENVSRHYLMNHSPVPALEQVSLRIDPGEVVAVAGPSGSGKTTLLNLIGCLDRPTSGIIRLEGGDVARLDAAGLSGLRRRRLGFVFQTFNLIPVFTAFENVEFPLLLTRLPEAERRQRVRLALEWVGMSGRAQHRPDLLSGGERQRIAVARALVHRPALVLADEPTANLDTANATEIVDLMRGLNRELGTTFLFATHDPRLLDRTRRVIRLCDGRIVSDRSSTEVTHEALSTTCV